MTTNRVDASCLARRARRRSGAHPAAARAGDRLLADAAVWLRASTPTPSARPHQTDLPVGRDGLAGRPPSGGRAARLTARTSGPGRRRGAKRASRAPATTASSGGVLERLGTEIGIDWPDGRRRGGRQLRRPAATSSAMYLGWLGPALADARAARRLGAGRAALGTPPGVDVRDRAGRSPRSSDRATTRGSRRRSPIRASPSTSRRGGPTRPTRDICSEPGARADVARGPLAHARPMEGEADLSTRSIDCCRAPTRSTRTSRTRGTRGPSWPRCAASTTRWPARRSHEREREPEPDPPVGYRRDARPDQPRGLVLEESPASTRSGGATEEWWGGGAGRSITLAATRPGRRGADAAQAFVEQFAGGLGPDAIDHRAGASSAGRG